MASISKENYIKCIFKLHNSGVKISISAIAKTLEVSLPSANSMIKNLHELGWIHYEKYQAIQMTDIGLKKAHNIIRKHRITEMFLVEQMGFAENEVHEIAEEMEHLNSEALFDRMDLLLNYPDFDPHGAPIPKKNGKIASDKKQYLSSLKPGEKGMLLQQNLSPEIHAFLHQFQLQFHQAFELLSIDDFDQSRWISCHGEKIAISAILAEELQIQRI